MQLLTKVHRNSTYLNKNCIQISSFSESFINSRICLCDRILLISSKLLLNNGAFCIFVNLFSPGDQKRKKITRGKYVLDFHIVLTYVSSGNDAFVFHNTFKTSFRWHPS